MAFLRGFGTYLPERTAGNEELAERLGVTPEWIFDVSGIERRRYASNEETVASMAVQAARDCLAKQDVEPSEIGMVIVATGSGERRFPGPAAAVAKQMGIKEAAAIDLPMASAGSLFGLALAAELARAYRNILVVGAEKMSTVVLREPLDRNVAILFGDGAGACLVSAESGNARIADALVQSDGAFTEDLWLGLDGPLEMNGRSVIMQASRKVPRAITALLQRNGLAAEAVEVFLMHQANQNLLNRIAKGIGVAAGKFYSNIARYGNTSSASMLIAAAEWWEASGGPAVDETVCFAAFGAGFHWGALLALGV